MRVSDYFKKEISYIQNDTLRQIVIETLDNSPECIVHIAASSSGKYHPAYSLGEGGLMRHIKAAVGIAHSMVETEIFKNMIYDTAVMKWEDVKEFYADVAYAALILHDCCKPDNTPKHNTRFDHPLIGANLFKDTARKHISSGNMEYMKMVVPMVHGCITSHMGEWCTATYAKGVVLPKPKKGIEHFVHLCDYLASRKFLIFDFDVYNDVER